MGRYAGFIALNAGIAGSADVILIPEIPFDIAKVCDKIRRREAKGRHFSIVVVAEGAAPKGGSVSLIDPAHQRLGGIADKVAHSIQEMTAKETRSLVLGHLQRGGSPTTCISAVPIKEAIAMPKRVPLDSDTIATARDIGISLGD